MFLNYEALNVSGTVDSPVAYTGSTIDTQFWGNVLLQVSASSVALTGTFQVTNIEERVGVPDPATWQTLLTLNVSNSVGSSSITPINSKYGRLLTDVTDGNSGSIDSRLSFSDRFIIISSSVVTPSDVSGAIAAAEISASQIVSGGQFTYAANSVPLIDTFTITPASSTASINPMSGSSQFLRVSADTQLSATFGSVPSGKSATTSCFVSASAVTMSFAGVDNWSGPNPSNVTAAGKYLLVLTNYLSASTPIVVGSFQTLV
jgi:hypothetical protein